jgi:predicted nucleic-acid-binding protein
MLSIDTNVLVRVLVDDAEAKQQCTLARQTVADVRHISVNKPIDDLAQREQSFLSR